MSKIMRDSPPSVLSYMVAFLHGLCSVTAEHIC